MEIYVVQPNDTIYTIASKFNVPARKIISDNELDLPLQLVPGQTIVIVYPKETYITKEGDTIKSIAREHKISQMQLLRNNPFLSEYPIIPGETLTISYNTTGKLTTSGYIYPYINKQVLIKTLPYLTYLTIYNYRVIDKGKIICYADDEKVVKLTNEYGTIPLMMVTTLSAQGDPDIETAYSILLNEEYQNTFVEDAVNFMTKKGYLGINVVFNYMNQASIHLHIKMITKLKEKIKDFGFLLFVTINPNTKYSSNEKNFDKVDYNAISPYISGIIFLPFIWGTNYGPPVPVNSIQTLQSNVDYAINLVPSDKILIGISLISFDWLLPYVPGTSYSNSLSISSALRLAYDTGSIIQFDKKSQSPYFHYVQGISSNHIVWSVDARTIDALMKLISNYHLNGAGFWNLMIYTPQLWLIINSQFEIEKLISSKFEL